MKMWSDADAEKAIQNLGDFEFEGRHISVERAKRTGPHTRTPGAYMGIDRRIRDRYAGMKRTRDYAPGEYPVAGGEQYPPMRRGGYRGRYEEYPRPRYDDRSGGWAPRPEYRQPYNERAFYEERPHSRRRYDEGPRYPPRDLDRVDDRYRDREPPVPRESGGSGDVI